MGTLRERFRVASFVLLVAVATAVLVPLTAQVAGATDRNVPGAYPTIQAAINASVNGDTVVVAPNTYFERIDFHGKAIEVRSAAGADTTIIDGQDLGAVVTIDESETLASVLRGFTIRNGDNALGGGGIRIQNASPTIVDNVIVGNTSSSGGGIRVISSSALISSNVIVSNDAQNSGGGLQAQDSNFTLVDNIIVDNASCSGAGVSVGELSPLIQGNLIFGNFQDFCSGIPGAGGGGIEVYSGMVQVVGNTIEGNDVIDNGGGVLLKNVGTQATLRDNIIDDNLAGVGGGIYADNATGSKLLDNLIVGNASFAGGGAFLTVTGTPPLFVNNTFAGNSPNGVQFNASPNGASFYNNIINNGVLCANAFLTPPTFRSNNISTYSSACGSTVINVNGNISQPPQFVDEASGVYRLDQSSLSINAGDNLAPSLPATDITGRARVVDGTVDQGAFEFFVPKGLPDAEVWEPAPEVLRKNLPPGVFTTGGASVGAAAPGPAAASSPSVKSEPIILATVTDPTTLPERRRAMRTARWRARHAHPKLG